MWERQPRTREVRVGVGVKMEAAAVWWIRGDSARGSGPARVQSDEFYRLNEHNTATVWHKDIQYGE